MRRYLLDTSVLSAFLLGRPGAVSLVAPWLTDREAATSILVYGEVIEHLRSKPDYQQRKLQLRQLLRQVTPYLLTYPIMERYADIRLRLRRGQLIGDVDTLIAATALERNLTLITIDPDFQRVPDLKVQLLTKQQVRISPP
jgi:predicted nucleic acid-binding protein